MFSPHGKAENLGSNCTKPEATAQTQSLARREGRQASSMAFPDISYIWVAFRRCFPLWGWDSPMLPSMEVPIQIHPEMCLFSDTRDNPVDSQLTQ